MFENDDDEIEDCTTRYYGPTNNLKYPNDTTLMAESEEELKSLLMRAEENWLETTFKKLRSWHLVPPPHGK